MKKIEKIIAFLWIAVVLGIIFLDIAGIASSYKEYTNTGDISVLIISVILGIVIIIFFVNVVLSTKYTNDKIDKMNNKVIKIKYFDNEIDKIKKISKGNWIDLRAAEDVTLKAGEFKLIPLGVGMKLPEGYEANFVPRSSTFKNYGLLQTNHYSVIDSSFCGDNDQWRYPVYATRDIVIHKNDRICQFRINEIQPNITFVEVDKLDDTDRGGFGSTGTK